MPDSDHNSSSGWKLVVHFIEETSWSSLIALGLVSFFFFYGSTNGLIKLTGRDIASIDFPIGPVVGVSSAIILVISCAVIKLQRKK